MTLNLPFFYKGFFFSCFVASLSHPHFYHLFLLFAYVGQETLGGIKHLLIYLSPQQLLCRQFRRLSAAELSDFGCFLALVCGVILLQQTGFVRKFGFLPIFPFAFAILYLGGGNKQGSFFVLVGCILNFAILLFFFVFRYQPDISHDSWSRDNQTLCGVQCPRGEGNQFVIDEKFKFIIYIWLDILPVSIYTQMDYPFLTCCIHYG